jgi:hypothetical protein
MILETVCLTTVGWVRWRDDDQRRQKRGLPLRGLSIQKHLVVITPDDAKSSIYPDGRVCVICPYDQPFTDEEGVVVTRDSSQFQGYAFLLPDEWTLED